MFEAERTEQVEQQETQMLRRFTFKWKMEKKEVLCLLKYTSAIQSILYLIFLVRSNHHLKYSGLESKKQFAVYNSDIPVTLKPSQGHQTWYELLDPKQGHKHAKFERLKRCPSKSQH